MLNANEANAKLNFKQLPPTLEFIALPNSPIELARGESFNYELIAEGNTDHNWTSAPIINGTAGSRTIIASGLHSYLHHHSLLQRSGRNW